jgi:hypothetical protein
MMSSSIKRTILDRAGVAHKPTPVIVAALRLVETLQVTPCDAALKAAVQCVCACTSSAGAFETAR